MTPISQRFAGKEVAPWFIAFLAFATTIAFVATIVVIKRPTDFAYKLYTWMELAAIILIVVGGLEALYTTFFASVRTLLETKFIPSPGRTTLFKRQETSGRFTGWLLLGLEFEIAADIIHTALAPTWDKIGPLAAIIGIRAFLNYVLEKDVRKAERSDAKGRQAWLTAVTKWR